MTAVETYYASGHCAVGAHDRCRGTYAGTSCQCACGHQPPEPEPPPAAPHKLRIGSLFSGYGGLEQGVQAVLGGEVAWHSEIDPGACKILAHRYPDVPNLGDITAIDWAAVEPVDVLTGGSPCQDVSAAGKRLGMRAGTRSGLWASMCDAIDIIRPSLVVWENVRGVLSAGADSAVEPCPICVGDDRDSHLRALGRVVGDLSELGYVGRWAGLRAADVGAPHGRFRVFVVAWPAGADAAELGRGAAGWDDGVRAARLVAGAAADTEGQGREGARPEPARRRPERGGGTSPHAERGGRDGRSGTSGPGRRPQPADSGNTAPHPEGHGRHEGRPEPARLIGGPDAAVCGDDAAADADGWGCEVGAELDGSTLEGATDWGARREHAHGHPSATDWGTYAPAIHRWERVLGRPAPSPTERSAKGSQRLSPRFVEWLMGLPGGWVTEVPGLSRNEQLKALGNGVVPQQAAAALRLLLPDVIGAAA